MSIKLFKIILSSPYEIVKYDWEHKWQFPFNLELPSRTILPFFKLRNFFFFFFFTSLATRDSSLSQAFFFLLLNTYDDLFVLLKVIMGFECPLRYKCIVQVLFEHYYLLLSLSVSACLSLRQVASKKASIIISRKPFLSSHRLSSCKRSLWALLFIFSLLIRTTEVDLGMSATTPPPFPPPPLTVMTYGFFRSLVSCNKICLRPPVSYVLP